MQVLGVILSPPVKGLKHKLQTFHKWKCVFNLNTVLDGGGLQARKLELKETTQVTNS
jgi:hypothetical protein